MIWLQLTIFQTVIDWNVWKGEKHTIIKVGVIWWNITRASIFMLTIITSTYCGWCGKWTVIRQVLTTSLLRALNIHSKAEWCVTVTKKVCVYLLRVAQGAAMLSLVGARWVQSSTISQEHRCYLSAVVLPGFQWKQTAGWKGFERICHRWLNICFEETQPGH